MSYHFLFRRRLAGGLLALVCALALAAVHAAEPPHGRLMDYPVAELMSVSNGTVERVEVDGVPVWRWSIETGKSSELALRPEHPLFNRLRYFDRFDMELNIAGGNVNELSFQALGHVSGARQYKVHQWTCALATTTPNVWHRRQWDLARPSWFPWDEKDGHGLAGFFNFSALALTPGTVIELRGLELTQALLVVKPEYELPVTWPVKTTNADGSVSYTIDYHLLNGGGEPTGVTAAVESQHARFKVAVSPEMVDLKVGERGTFTVTATISAADIAATPDLYGEPYLLRFTQSAPPGTSAIASGWFVRPLSAGLQRQVVIPAADLATVRQRLAAGDEALAKALKLAPIKANADDFLKKRLLALPTAPTRVRNNWLTTKIDGKSVEWRPGDFMPEVVTVDGSRREVNTYVASATWHEYLGHRGGAAEDLGLAYAYTGDEAYAEKAVALFELFAAQYGDLPWYSQFDPAWNRGIANLASSRMFTSSTYGTNWSFKGMCRLASLTADSPAWTPEVRERVYKGFVLPYATELMKFPGGISNMTDITNHNLLLLGIAFDDAGLVRFATMSDPGLMARLTDIDADGFSAEGRPIGYHFAGMEEYLPSLVFMANAGLAIDFPRERVLQAIRMPYLRAALTGRVPNTGDSGRYLAAPATTGLADWLACLFPEERWLLDIGRGSNVTSILRRLERADAPPKDAWRALLEAEPRLFPVAGLGILRQGDSPETQVMATLDYGRNVFHAALDRNQFTLMAFGSTYSHGPGSLYNVGSGGMTRTKDPRLDAFCSHGSLGQNVVLVDQLDQTPAVGELLAWSAGPARQVMASRVDGLQPGVRHTRAVVLEQGIVILLDRIEAAAPHTLDWVYHNLGSATAGGGWSATPRTEPLGKTANYDLLVDLQTLEPAKAGATVQLNWAIPTADAEDAPKVHLGLWQLPLAGASHFLATTGMNNPNTRTIPDRAPSLITRVAGTGTPVTLLTVLEPYRDAPRVTGVSAQGAAGITVHLADGSTLQADLDALLKQHAVAPAK